MKSLCDKITAQQCVKHGSPYSFIYNKDNTTEYMMICDECINPQTDNGKLISIRKAFKFFEEQLIHRN